MSISGSSGWFHWYSSTLFQDQNPSNVMCRLDLQEHTSSWQDTILCHHHFNKSKRMMISRQVKILSNIITKSYIFIVWKSILKYLKFSKEDIYKNQDSTTNLVHYIVHNIVKHFIYERRVATYRFAAIILAVFPNLDTRFRHLSFLSIALSFLLSSLFLKCLEPQEKGGYYLVQVLMYLISTSLQKLTRQTICHVLLSSSIDKFLRL